MGFKKPHIAVILGLVALFVALIFQIIAVAATGWYRTKYTDDIYGLWGGCSAGICSDYTSVSDIMKATSAFALLGLIFIAVALAAGILIMFIDKKVMPLIAGGVAIAAAVFVVTGIVIFLATYLPDAIASQTPENFQLSYCFALTVVAFVLCIASGISFIVPKFL